MKMSAALAQDIADAMTLIHKGWQVPGCKRLLLDYASEARTVPLAEVGAAALLFAQAPGITAPSLELFRSGPWWTAQMPAHARTVRPSDAPRCPKPGHTSYPASNCGACRSEQLEDPAPRPVVLVDASQAATNTAGARRAMAALGRREGEETR